MDFILTLHGDLRWLVALVALIAIVKYAIGWLGKGEYKRIDRIILIAFITLLDINLLLGIVMLMAEGFDRHRAEHAFTMIIAIIIAHSSSIWRRKETDSAKLFRNSLLTVLAAMIIIILGVVRLRGGWVF